MAESETIVHGNFSVTVEEATVLAGMKRTRLRVEAGEEAEHQMDIDRRILRLVVYPDLVAAVVKHDGFETWPPDFETFLGLPDSFVARWEQAVYRLNPHWLPGEDEEREKKQPMNSTDG